MLGAHCVRAARKRSASVSRQIVFVHKHFAKNQKTGGAVFLFQQKKNSQKHCFELRKTKKSSLFTKFISLKFGGLIFCIFLFFYKKKRKSKRKKNEHVKLYTLTKKKD